MNKKSGAVNSDGCDSVTHPTRFVCLDFNWAHTCTSAQAVLPFYFDCNDIFHTSQPWRIVYVLGSERVNTHSYQQSEMEA